MAERAAALDAGRLELLGHTVPWDALARYESDTSRLWRYHFHYHDHLAEAAWACRQNQAEGTADRLVSGLEAWLETWERGGSPAWDAYPVSVRIVNWLRMLGWAGPTLPAALHDRVRRSHAEHVAFLARNLEHHLQGNHLLRNLSALVVGSHAWSGGSFDELRQRASRLYFNEILAQVGEDGAHEERSPMYHARALRDALEVLAVLRAFARPVPEQVLDRLSRMSAVLPWLRRPNGELVLWNDTMADHDIDLDALTALCRDHLGAPAEQPSGLRVFGDVGLVVATAPEEHDFLMMDVGGPAPRHQPGHAHAGALGLELDLGGVPVLVDPGCSGYDDDPFRPYFRSTRAHNTVTLDGLDQSEMWATFRVAGRASVELVRAGGKGDDLVIEGTCRPHHAGSACHRRRVERRGRAVVIDDRVERAPGALVEAHWHFHPEWDVELSGSTIIGRHARGSGVVMRVEGADRVTTHRGEGEPPLGWYARGIDDRVPTWTVRATLVPNDDRGVRTVVEPTR